MKVNRLSTLMKYAKDYWATIAGPAIVVGTAGQIAYVGGLMGLWWLSALAVALCGFAVSWAASVAEARAQTKWAAVLVKTLASGEDTTITVEHIHLERRGEQP